MGPRPNALPEGLEDITGDVTDPNTVISLGIGVKSRFTNTAGAVLYTSDVGIDVTGDYAGQEENTSAINYGQIISGLLALAPGGNFVTKQYTFFTPFSRSLIALVASFFEETYITKPATSRPGNSEVYLVGKGFKILGHAGCFSRGRPGLIYGGGRVFHECAGEVSGRICGGLSELYQ